MIHYHGGRHSTWQVAVEIWKGRHALVSYAEPQQLGIAAEVAQSFALDNGAFTVWKQGIEIDWTVVLRAGSSSGIGIPASIGR